MTSRRAPRVGPPVAAPELHEVPHARAQALLTREAAQQMREHAARARGLAEQMTTDNTERRVRMGQLLWQLLHEQMARRTRARG